MSYVKVLERSAVFAWSPASFPSSYLAAGTNGQQVDSSFSTTSTIDLCRLDFTAHDAFSPTLRPNASGDAEFRFHRLAWAEIGGKLGTLIGGCENGAIVLYDPAIKLDDPVGQTKSWCVKQSRKHTGTVRALDLNPFQKQLLVSGASNGDVFIFDLSNIEQPMTPGPRPAGESQQGVVSVGWNGRVEHILATLFPSYAYVWDLRRSDGPIMKLGDLGGGRGQWTTLKWHPDSSTTFCLASGDDHYPVVQMWDVRFANSACAELEGHQRGILSMDWCVKDSDLLVTCGKDMKVYVWNPNTSQYLAEIPLSTAGAAGLAHSWPFEVQWSKRDPHLVGVASFDGRIGIYSVSGAVAGLGDNTALSATPAATPKLAESFPGADFAFQPAAMHKMLQDRQQQLHNLPRVALPYPPKWMRSSCCARFAFGGKLIACSNPEPNQDGNPTTYMVDVFQVITEPSIFEKAAELHKALSGDGSSLSLPFVAELCGQRAVQASEESEKCIWQCLQAHVQRQSRQRYIEIVGGAVDVQALGEKMKRLCNISLSRSEESDALLNGSASTQENVAICDYQDDEAEAEAEDEDDVPSPWPTSPDEVGQLELPTDTQSREGLLCRLISACKMSTAVELCIAEDRWLDAMQLSSLASRRLYDQTQRRYYERLKDPVSKFICLLANERWDLLVSTISVRHPESWRLVFSILLKYVQSNDLPEYLERLGKRMESSGVEDRSCRALAPACYIAAGWVEQFVENLTTQKGFASLTAEQLHDIVEKATILRISLGGGSQRALEVGPQLADKLGRYANLLVEQGCLTLALQLLDALPENTNQHLMELRHRAYMSCAGYVPANIRQPKVPYASVNRAAVTSQYQQQQFPAAPRSRSGSYVPPPPTPSAQLYGSNAGDSSQVYGQPPPTPSAAQHAQAAVSAIKTTRNRYPSYSSDGISYPSSTAMASGVRHSAYPATVAAPTSYQPQQQYPSFAASTPAYQQQQPPPPPPPIGQQPVSSNANAYRPPVANSVSPTSHIGHHHYHRSPSIPHPTMPPPPPGPATELQHRPWNDPPPLSPKKKSAPTKAELPTPVTFPVLGAGGVPSAIDQVPAQFPLQSVYQQEPPGIYQPLQQQQQSNQHSPTPPPAPTVPAEHEIVLSVLRRLGELAAAQAPNVQTRRRIEDSLQKLNANLPLLLASCKLSKLTVAELHQLVDFIRAYDYNSALALNARIVEGADFATIASFMPSVKVLIQSAAQMGVYFS